MSMADVLISHDEEHRLCGVAETAKGLVWLNTDHGDSDLVAAVDHLGDLTVVEGLRAAGYTDEVLRDLHTSGSVEDLRRFVGHLLGASVEQPRVVRVCDVLAGTEYDEAALNDLRLDVGKLMRKCGDRGLVREVFAFFGSLRGYRRISEFGDLQILRGRIRADIEACRQSDELTGREVVMCVVDDLLGCLIGEDGIDRGEAGVRLDRYADLLDVEDHTAVCEGAPALGRQQRTPDIHGQARMHEGRRART